MKINNTTNYRTFARYAKKRFSSVLINNKSKPTQILNESADVEIRRSYESKNGLVVITDKCRMTLT